MKAYICSFGARDNTLRMGDIKWKRTEVAGDQWPGLRVEELTLSLIQVFKYLMHWDKEGSPLNEIECLLENLLPRVWCNLTVAKQPGCYSSMASQSPFITPLKCFSVVLDLLLITASFKEGKEKGGREGEKARGVFAIAYTDSIIQKARHL